MKLKSEFTNAAQLFLLLCLLFWSFTWNLPSNLPLCQNETCNMNANIAVKEESDTKQDGSTLFNGQVSLSGTSATVKYASKETSEVLHPESDSILPPFNEWKEKERTKYDEGSLDEIKQSTHRKITRRKLNYSSSKCGAKILISNPEAKHKTAILNEKVDEYMLNPCRVRTWFVIELCDTIEATQIEVANYELYSSSPKTFSVFWSDVYPTMVWHHLGTFEAKYQRTMQTFDLQTKNLGKFIKIIIYSHHGKEHYCPLSVIRVLGYSMVQEFEDIENEKSISAANINSHPKAQEEEDITPENESHLLHQHRTQRPGKQIPSPNSVASQKLCSLLSFCSDTSTKRTGKDDICVDEPVCRFLSGIIPNSDALCNLNVCPSKPELFAKIDNSFQNVPKEDVSLLTGVVKNNTLLENSTRLKTSSFSEFNKTLEVYQKKGTDVDKQDNIYIPFIIKKDKSLGNTKSNVSNHENRHNQRNYLNQTRVESSRKSQEDSKPSLEKNRSNDCICKDDINWERSLDNKHVTNNNADTENSVDSAGLIQKESVLIKLTSRIKASEIDINLINKYLQQLSESYRYKMENMQAMYQQTVNSINIASEKAALVDKNQHDSIEALQNKLVLLNHKVELFVNGQQDIMKTVVELHVFFLILEIIIMSTIFTVFLNIFHRQNMIQKKHYVWKYGA